MSGIVLHKQTPGLASMVSK